MESEKGTRVLNPIANDGVALQSELEAAVMDKSSMMSAIFSSAVDSIVVINELGIVNAFNTAAEKVSALVWSGIAVRLRRS